VREAKSTLPEFKWSGELYGLAADHWADGRNRRGDSQGGRMIGARFPLQRNQAWISLAILGFGLCLAWSLGDWIAAGNTQSIMYAALAVAFCAIVVTVLRDWRTGSYAFLVWQLFEDLVRKYMGNNMAIYFGKDVLVAIVYLSFFISVRAQKTKLFRPPFRLFLSLFFWLGVLECFNPNSPSVFYGILGLKLYFYYIPLMFVGYALIETHSDLRRFLTFNMSLAGLISLLGIIQAIVGVSFLNPRVLAPEIRELSNVYRYSPITGQMVFRPSSVFVSDGRFAWYLTMVWLIGLGSVGYLVLRRERQTVVFVGTALVAVAAVLCGSRGTVVFIAASSFVVAAAFLWGSPWRREGGHRLLKAIRRGFIAAGIGVVIAVVLFPVAIGARWSFYSETLDPRSSESELGFRAMDYPIAEFQKAFPQTNWVYGDGIGTASLGMQYVSRILGQASTNFGVESGYGNLFIEFGTIGLLLWLLWTAAVVMASWKVVLRVRQTSVFPIAFAICWFIFLLLFPMTFASIGPYENYIYNAYLWLSVGILFRLPALVARQGGVSSPAERHIG
jgi:hypothetical protein